MSFGVPENCRVVDGHPRATLPYSSKNGLFVLAGPCGVDLWCVASDGSDWAKTGMAWPAWEHVSVSVRSNKRCPNWQEMCFVKSAFWHPEDCVIQFHPPQSAYVNNHESVLHLWRPVGVEIPRPPTECVGILGVQFQTLPTNQGQIK